MSYFSVAKLLVTGYIFPSKCTVFVYHETAPIAIFPNIAVLHDNFMTLAMTLALVSII